MTDRPNNSEKIGIEATIVQTRQAAIRALAEILLTQEESVNDSTIIPASHIQQLVLMLAGTYWFITDAAERQLSIGFKKDITFGSFMETLAKQLRRMIN